MMVEPTPKDFARVHAEYLQHTAENEARMRKSTERAVADMTSLDFDKLANFHAVAESEHALYGQMIYDTLCRMAVAESDQIEATVAEAQRTYDAMIAAIIHCAKVCHLTTNEENHGCGPHLMRGNEPSWSVADLVGICSEMLERDYWRMETLHPAYQPGGTQWQAEQKRADKMKEVADGKA